MKKSNKSEVRISCDLYIERAELKYYLNTIIFPCYTTKRAAVTKHLFVCLFVCLSVVVVMVILLLVR